MPTNSSPYRRAESASRQWVLYVGWGVTAYYLGSFLAAYLGEWLLTTARPFENDIATWVFGWLLRRMWLWLVLPLGAYGLCRWTTAKPVRLAVVSALAGELFSLLLIVGVNGVEFLVDDPMEVVIRIVSLVGGIALAVVLARAGQRRARTR